MKATSEVLDGDGLQRGTQVASADGGCHTAHTEEDLINACGRKTQL